GMTGGLVAVCGWLWRADALTAQPPVAVEVALRVIAIDTLLLVSHYAVQGIRLRLLGRGWRAYLHELALPGIIAEASLMPIGVVFSRLSRTRKQLEERVHDLEILTATARRLAASLQLEELVEAVAREACKAIPEAEAVSLVHRG